MISYSKPPATPPSIKAAPKIRQIYWCNFWKDACLPEMWKMRPVIIISYKHKLHSHSTVIPTSTTIQDDNEWAYKLSIEIEENGVKSYAICNQPYTVSNSRLTKFRGAIPLLPKEDFNHILEKLMKWLPQPFSLYHSCFKICEIIYNNSIL
ncbi:MAG: type II toxin-antitoxin system PemK/MazF family toxin, partial [Pseudomonadota bacterium]